MANTNFISTKAKTGGILDLQTNLTFSVANVFHSEILLRLTNASIEQVNTAVISLDIKVKHANSNEQIDFKLVESCELIKTEGGYQILFWFAPKKPSNQDCIVQVFSQFAGQYARSKNFRIEGEQHEDEGSNSFVAWVHKQLPLLRTRYKEWIVFLVGLNVVHLAVSYSCQYIPFSIQILRIWIENGMYWHE